MFLALALAAICPLNAKDPYFGVYHNLNWDTPHRYEDFADWAEVVRLIDATNAGSIRLNNVLTSFVYPVRNGTFAPRFFGRDAITAVDLAPGFDLDGDGRDADFFGYSRIGLARLDAILASIPRDVAILFVISFSDEGTQASPFWQWSPRFHFQADGTLRPAPNRPDATLAAANYAKLVYFLVDRYRDRVRAWELDNEPDRKSRNLPYPPGADLARDYTGAVLRPGAQAARLADPSTTILIGGLATRGGDAAMPVQERHFLDRVLKAGGGDAFDVLSLHPYAHEGDDDGDGVTPQPFVSAYGVGANGQPLRPWFRPWEPSPASPGHWGNIGWRAFPRTSSWASVGPDDLREFQPGSRNLLQVLQASDRHYPLWITEFGELFAFNAPAAVPASPFDVERLFLEPVDEGFLGHPRLPLERSFWWSLRDLPCGPGHVPEEWRLATHAAPVGLFAAGKPGLRTVLNSGTSATTPQSVNDPQPTFHAFLAAVASLGGLSTLHESFGAADDPACSSPRDARWDTWGPGSESSKSISDKLLDVGLPTRLSGMTTRVPVRFRIPWEPAELRFAVDSPPTPETHANVTLVVAPASDQPGAGSFGIQVRSLPDRRAEVILFAKPGPSASPRILYSGRVTRPAVEPFHRLRFRFAADGRYRLFVNGRWVAAGQATAMRFGVAYAASFVLDGGEAKDPISSRLDDIVLSNQILPNAHEIAALGIDDLTPRAFFEDFATDAVSARFGRIRYHLDQFTRFRLWPLASPADAPPAGEVYQREGKLHFAVDPASPTVARLGLALNRRFQLPTDSQRNLVDLAFSLPPGATFVVGLDTEIPLGPYLPNRVEIEAAADGSQAVLRLFVDGSAEPLFVHTSPLEPESAINLRLHRGEGAHSLEFALSGGAVLSGEAPQFLAASGIGASRRFGVGLQAIAAPGSGVTLDHVAVGSPRDTPTFEPSRRAGAQPPAPGSPPLRFLL